MTGNQHADFTKKGIVFSCVLITGFFFSFLVGRYVIPLKIIVDVLLSKLTGAVPYWDRTIETVIVGVRLPRILQAIMVGGALSLSGASYQTLFKNPMVSPDILGVSAGAGFGAALAMIFRASWWEIQLCAFIFGIIAVLVSWMISDKLSIWAAGDHHPDPGGNRGFQSVPGAAFHHQNSCGY